MLDLAHEDRLALGFFHRSSGLFRKNNQVHDKSDVVHQSGEIGFLRTLESNRARQLASQDGARQRMLPEDYGIENLSRSRNNF
jgi:hypothetical protein